jgi:hypothetical protein
VQLQPGHLLARPSGSGYPVRLMNDVCRLISAPNQGAPHAASRLLPLVYDELGKLAAQRMTQEQRCRRSGPQLWYTRDSCVKGQRLGTPPTWFALNPAAVVFDSSGGRHSKASQSSATARTSWRVSRPCGELGGERG